ncbi:MULTISPECIES: MocR-like pyridoxine biosynthesis transcription factor PdxR [unclassified Pseudomonas]|jgi:GntR family transcriptional regulator/MocR family aminotransferase|uniref:MocR-like pyridoxine biosynthesis transcription factor PdxR n=1 Tax=unclassified Pseudomonas TaxID=196821 RepID=UPI000C86C901|nr:MULTISPECIES: PLP-dependent aminotransferase family protein [unclassified Pseudomonas]PMV17719.1 PLP-dependent aminotransferase family protein [Pseudomonas sp. FW305-3-2-15-C-TSA2]PMV28195.1 PLP-dependent aminotransferase family protein [Pseudomonas sp. DP16D-L5]PMV35591.1 PLP-dependent aminotransferase family protein [Pseudomonas sp. FW305-3-2-15-A-LB2]PMV41469.1 PLP-dependent aminotransferase family protein [Pseudomonas sp. FW305-3-2-15-C-R2A1]PMV44856.1 PLP-dependent aminotransferase fam
MVQMRKWRPLLKLDESASQASYRKIAEGLVTAIVEGRLPPGTLLPGTREMAQLLDVNRKTVILAYEEAMTKGWLVSEPRRGTFVNAQLAPKPMPNRAQPSFAPPILAQANAPYFTQNAQATALQHRHGALFFDNGTSDHRLLPQAVLHRHYRNALRNSFASNTVRYGSEGTGYELRCALAEMLRNNRGLTVSAENICLTQGTQMSLYLSASLLLKPGDVVLVERLSYPPAWEIFRKLGAQLVTVDVDDEGCRTDQIDRLCREHKVRMIYLTPHHQFPTTVSLHAARRQQLLALAALHEFCIIEEDYDHEYHFNGRPYLPLASDRSQRHVLYVGSLSKALGSTFRCSYVVAPTPVIEALHGNAALMLGDADAVAQKMLADLINAGELKKHLRRVSKEYRARRETLQGCLHAAFGDRIMVREPEGGLALWVRFEDRINVDQMAATALEHGLVVRSGRQFSPMDRPENALRLGFASLNQAEIREATVRLAKAVNLCAHKNADHR